MRNMQKATNKKIIASGSIVEIFHFENPILYGKTSKIDKTIRLNKKKKGLNSIRTEKSWRRASIKLKRLTNQNVYNWFSITGNPLMPIFITLTFAENIKDIKQANNLFTLFIKKLTYFLTKSKKSALKYLAVIEFQKRGAVHYHIIFFNLPFIINIYDEMKRIWGYGFVIVKSLKNIDNIGSYITKYMTKDFNDQRLAGNKAYFVSRNLIKPDQILNPIIVNSIEKRLLEFLKYKKEYESEFCGKIIYKYYNLNGKRLSDFGIVIPKDKV